MKNNSEWMRSLCWVVGFSFLGAGAFAQGSLTPPGAPAPTMKSLTEVFDAATATQDPRVAVNSTNTPGDSGAVFKITQRGSYYLTGNLTGASTKNGIRITTAGVSLDLNGFSVIGVTGSLAGITADSSADRAIVSNGIVSNWGLSGVRLSNESLIQNVIASGNGSIGIIVASSCIVRNCVARQNQSIGIQADSASLIKDSSADSNTSTGISLENQGGRVVGCSANLNGVSGIGGADSSGGWIIQDNACNGNTLHGIDMCLGNTIINNVCDSNGSVGIQVRCGNNRVESNNLVRNSIGILAEGFHNEMVFRNTAVGNITNYISFLGNDFGPFGTAATATSPFANISHLE